MTAPTEEATEAELEVLDQSLSEMRERIREHRDQEDTPDGERRAGLRLVHEAGRVRERLEAYLDGEEARRGA